MAGARWIALVALVAIAALAMAATGCGEESSTDVERVALVVPGTDNDPDWTLQAKQAIEDVPQRLGVRVSVADASDAGDVRAVLEQVADEGNQLVIVHDGRYAAAAKAVAEDSGVPALVLDDASATGGDVASIVPQDKEPGYMFGLAATKAAFTRRVGIVVTDDSTPADFAMWNRMAGGFVAGARSIDPDVTVVYQHVGKDGVATARQAYDATMAMIRFGIQMILGVGGPASVGALQAVDEYKANEETLFIGAVSDRSSTREYEGGGVPHILGTINWNLRGAYRQAIRDVRDDTFGEHPYRLTLANRGIVLEPSGRMPIDAFEAALEAGEQISAGKIEVPTTSSPASVETLIVEHSRG